jgi:hypothetical protein
MTRQGYKQITTIILTALIAVFSWSYLAIGATYDATGTWDYSTYNHWSDCGDPDAPGTGYATLTQTGDTFTLILDGNEHYTGTINGPNYTCTRSYPDEGGIATQTLYFTFTSNTTGSGTTTWTWTDGHYSCRGGNHFSATKQVATTGSNQPFGDVPSAHWAADYINAIYEAGITTGYGDGTYGPEDPVSREQMAVFIIRALYGETFSYNSTPYFVDVPSSHWAFKYIQKLKELGITTGCGFNEYCPSELVTRDQMAAFLIRAKIGEDFSYDPNPYFTDVPYGYWAFHYAQKLKELGITTGCGSGRYCPQDMVTRDQMAAFLTRAFLDMPQTLPPVAESLSSFSPIVVRNPDGELITPTWRYRINSGQPLQIYEEGEYLSFSFSDLQLTINPKTLVRNVSFSGNVSGDMSGSFAVQVNETLDSSSEATLVNRQDIDMDFSLSAYGETIYLAVDMATSFSPPAEWFLDRDSLDTLPIGYDESSDVSGTTGGSIRMTGSYNYSTSIPSQSVYCSDVWTIVNHLENMAVCGVSYSNVVEVKRTTVIPVFDGSNISNQPYQITYWVAKGVGMIKGIGQYQLLGSPLTIELAETNLRQ